MQTTVGGLAGVLIGVAAIFLVPPIVEWTAGLHMPAKINDFSFYISLAVAISVGVLFGWYPARRAALLDPIEALRHE